ncbi:MAG: GNAT family N-acetyltransferase [Vicinamibacteraceae bacterium]
MTVANDVSIEEWRPDLADAAAVARDVDDLAGVLHAVVHGGAGVSFVVPFSRDDARAFWTGSVLPPTRARQRRTLVARAAGRIVATVQLDPAWAPNQPHRAEVLKLLVHPDARRRGIARRLMVALEDLAGANGWSLLTLDTWTGQAGEQLYRSLGYTAVGAIPRFARGSTTIELEPATIMYKELDHATSAARRPDRCG